MAKWLKSPYILKINFFAKFLFLKKEKLGSSLRLELYSKKFLKFLLNDVGIINKKKSFNAEIPKKYLKWKYSKHILRGIFETDGSLYFSKSRMIKYPSYPRIEIKTSSKKLASQMFTLLKQKAFKVQKRPSKTDRTIRVYLSGSEMLEKWLREIGFSSMKKYSKYLFWKKLGYYIPKIPYKKRLILIREGSQVAKISKSKADSKRPPAERIFMGSNPIPPFYSNKKINGDIKNE